MRLATFLMLGAVACLAPATFGGLLTLAGQNDSVDFNNYQLGGATSAFQTISGGGVTVVISEPSSAFTFMKQNSGWAGNFPDKTILVFNQGGGIVTFAFSTPIQGFGLNIDDAVSGNYTASIDTYNGATLETAFTTLSEPYGLVFLSQVDATADITSVTISTTAVQNNSFAFSNISLIDGASVAPLAPAGVPEPASFGGLFLGLTMLGGIAKLRARA